MFFFGTETFLSFFFVYFVCNSASAGFPIPPDCNPKFSAGVWYCRYLYFVDQDGVAPAADEFFFRAFERGKFVRKRLGKKKYSALMKEIATFCGYDPKKYSGSLLFLGFFFVFFVFFVF